LRNPLERALVVELDLRREDEARQLVSRLREIIGRWRVIEGDHTRPASYRDIMILVKRRTHLAIYEQQLRAGAIPFVTSRQGGLLGTLEARDMRALLEFIVSPFADLKLAHALRTPIFDCSDEDLMVLSQTPGTSWWERMRTIASTQHASPAIQRAHTLLHRWLAHSDGLPVHDQLDRIYFEGDVMRRYTAAAPEAMREAVRANLHAFMQRALDTDAGRYPSLPRFIHELIDLADAPVQEAPDEGIVGDVGDAVRIYTVHGAKGLEAPIVWLLDAAAGQEPANSYDMVVDWPPSATQPSHFSVCTVKAERSACQQQLLEAEDELTRREELNLLYVAMTRAQQALIVSGCDGQGVTDSWYQKVRGAVRTVNDDSLSVDDTGVAAVYGDALDEGAVSDEATLRAKVDESAVTSIDTRLTSVMPTGVRRPATHSGEAYGTRFHRLMERVTANGTHAGPHQRSLIQRELAIPEREFAPMWNSAQKLLSDPELKRYFDPAHYVRAANELGFVSAAGEVSRVDRLVEFDDEAWVLDYKTGELPEGAVLLAQYEAQVRDYCAAISTLLPGKRVRALLVFANGAHRVVATSRV
jgi:ATP-dependent helicase/nuclease subunit A